MGSKLQNFYQNSTKYFTSTYLCSLCSTKLHVSISKNHRQTKYEEFILARIHENLYEEVGVKRFYRQGGVKNLYKEHIQAIKYEEFIPVSRY